MHYTKFISLLAVTLMIASCGNSNSKVKSLAEGASGNIVAYENSAVNAIQQALPTLMVLPSDNLMKNSGALTTQTINGKSVVMRDYNKFFTSNMDNKAIISVIQNAFVQVNYPIQDLEQTLKQLETQEALDMVDGMEKDAKTMLLTVAQPDMIIELDYNSSFDMKKPVNEARTISYTLNVIDSYTSTVISSTSETGLTGENTASILSAGLEKSAKKMTSEIQNAFSDILTRGRNVTVRIAVGAGCDFSLNDDSIVDEPYSDWIVDYIKTHTVKGAYKMQRNTDKELYFVNCRIPLLNEDGTQYGVYDWARDMSKSIRKNLGVKATNKSQGLGEILITLDGLK
ncbi:MAG: hypothetical protein IKA81_04185 [Alistipes sp.]|nr:hypothetical protein [Alistipes sp.]